METYEFLQNNRQRNSLITTYGIESSWNYLRQEFNLSGSGISEANYSEIINGEESQVFAVMERQQVFHHDNGRWHRYNSLNNIEFDLISVEANDLERTVEENLIERVTEQLFEEEQRGPDNELH